MLSRCGGDEETGTGEKKMRKRNSSLCNSTTKYVVHLYAFITSMAMTGRITLSLVHLCKGCLCICLCIYHFLCLCLCICLCLCLNGLITCMLSCPAWPWPAEELSALLYICVRAVLRVSGVNRQLWKGFGVNIFNIVNILNISIFVDLNIRIP